MVFLFSASSMATAVSQSFEQIGQFYFARPVLGTRHLNGFWAGRHPPPASNALFAHCFCDAGQEVALWVKDNFKKELIKLQSYKSKCYKEALEECFLKLDELMETPAGQRRLMELQSQSDGGFGDGKSFAGCTATVILITRTEIICANSGDSRTVLSRAGRAREMSEDHKPENPGELSRIKRSGGFVEEGRVNGMLALSRALGDFEYKGNSQLPPREQAVSAYPDVRIEPIDAQTQFVILACDGIWDVKTSQESVDFLMSRLYRNNFSQRVSM